MKSITETNIKGVYEIEMFHLVDHRGAFVKPYHADTLKKWGLQSDYKESFYSTNNKGVIRGMHYQNPPDAHEKIVYCSSGKLVDVILDIRKDSPTFGQVAEIELAADKFNAVYMPIGVAHGFKVIEDNTCMVYLTSTVHSPQSDAGVLWNSFDYDWKLENPILSERDTLFDALSEINSLF